jgi:hypothetical protein
VGTDAEEGRMENGGSGGCEGERRGKRKRRKAGWLQASKACKAGKCALGEGGKWKKKRKKGGFTQRKLKRENEAQWNSVCRACMRA